MRLLVQRQCDNSGPDADRGQPGTPGALPPQPEMVDEIMYKSIAIGFAFFTIATILGAMWATDA